MRDFQRPRFRDVSKRVPAEVAVVRRIRELTYPNAVQHDPENSLEFLHIPAPQAAFSRTLPHPAVRHCHRATPVSCSGRGKFGISAGEGDRFFVLPASSRRSQFLPCLSYSVSNRSLNYFPFACVVPDSGGVPWPRVAIPREFPSSSRLS